jgi:NADPH-dependent 2,4-dienoyl-CoA reductase/sulfur reductase-like enzyme
MLDHGVGKVGLAVDFEGPRRNRQSSRGGAGLRRLIGAGPTGLVLALWLTKLGVKVRIIDQNVTVHHLVLRL